MSGNIRVTFLQLSLAYARLTSTSTLLTLTPFYICPFRIEPNTLLRSLRSCMPPLLITPSHPFPLTGVPSRLNPTPSCSACSRA